MKIRYFQHETKPVGRFSRPRLDSFLGAKVLADK